MKGDGKNVCCGGSIAGWFLACCWCVHGVNLHSVVVFFFSFGRQYKVNVVRKCLPRVERGNKSTTPSKKNSSADNGGEINQ